MHVLIVIDHPDQGSFTHAVAARFADGLAAADHSAEVADLHAEGFNPIWSAADVVHGADGPVPGDIVAEQARIERCDAIAFVFPLFWFSMPAMTKGWIDRVFTYGWAYDQVGNPNQSLLKDRIGVMVIPSGGKVSNWNQHGLTHSMETLWQTGMMGYFGLNDKRIHFLNGSEGSDARRATLLSRAYEIGAEL